VHFTSLETKSDPLFFCEGVDKEGEACQVPVDDVFHDEEFTKADIVYKPSLSGAKIGGEAAPLSSRQSTRDLFVV